jgi:hypothetical protein
MRARRVTPESGRKCAKLQPLGRSARDDRDAAAGGAGARACRWRARRIRKPKHFRRDARLANRVGSAAAICAGLLLVACATPTPSEPEARVFKAPAPSESERYCAWFGDARERVLYFGESAFWSASRDESGRLGADPFGDLRSAGPLHIGRFDLARERWLEPLDVGEPDERSGVWDVLAHENGRVYFTNFWGPAGWVDPASGEVVRFPDLGRGLNELARGPGESLFVSRYIDPDDVPGGSIVHFDSDGRLLADHHLRAPAGYLAAPKTVAWDPVRREIWVTSDLFPTAGHAVRHDAYVLDEHGAELRRIERPEIQFVVFAPDGTGYLAEVEEGELWLRITAPGGGSERRLLLDGAFPMTLDFAQDIKLTPEGGALVARWSGRLHEVDARGELRSDRLPRVAPDGLYYTAVRDDGRICGTHCADVQIVCQDADGPR